MPDAPPIHVPVMAAECLEYLALKPGDVAVDATLGLGGHALEMLRAVGHNGRVIGVDRDPEALRRAESRLRGACADWGWGACPIACVASDFRHLDQVLADAPPVCGVLFDLGVSSMQLDRAERGFSFRGDGPLDMRMNPEQETTAADLVNTLAEAELARVLWECGEERHSRRIARRIVERRPLHTTRALEEAIWSAYPAAERKARLHPATRSFQALRIAVNDELAALEPALQAAARALAPGGRIVVLSYHSLEDRIVKRAFEYLAGRCRCPVDFPVCQCRPIARVRLVTRKPLAPTEAEVEANPRARSAKLRAVEAILVPT